MAERWNHWQKKSKPRVRVLAVDLERGAQTLLPARAEGDDGQPEKSEAPVTGWQLVVSARPLRTAPA